MTAPAPTARLQRPRRRQAVRAAVGERGGHRVAGAGGIDDAHLRAGRLAQLAAEQRERAAFRARDDDVHRTGLGDPVDGGDHVIVLASGRPAVLDELVLAHLDDVDAALERLAQELALEVDDDRDAVRAQVGREPLVGALGQHGALALGSCEHAHARLERRAERHGVEVVDLVAAECRELALPPLVALTLAAVVHVCAARLAHGDRPRVELVGRDQVAEDVARLAPERRDENRRGSEMLEHARDPETLAARMDVELAGVARAALDGHGEDRRGREHADMHPASSHATAAAKRQA